jgi:hypothetical protein
MNTRIVIFALAFVALLMIAREGGINGKVVFVTCFVSVIYGIPGYFYKRRATSPTRFEIIAATVWLWIRRIVGLVGALFFLVISVISAFDLFPIFPGCDLIERIGYAIFLLIVAIFSLWVAIYGQGLRRGEWKDDVELHRENMKRYHWRR